MTGRLCLREEQVAAVNAALEPLGRSELAWALDVLDTLERCGIRDGSDLPAHRPCPGAARRGRGIRHRRGCRRGARLRLRELSGAKLGHSAGTTGRGSSIRSAGFGPPPMRLRSTT